DCLLTAIYKGKNEFGIASLDLSSGQFKVMQSPDLENVKRELNRIQPSEILISETEDVQLNKDEINCRITIRAADIFDITSSQEIIKKQYSLPTLKGQDIEGRHSIICAAGAALYFARETQCQELLHIRPIQIENTSDWILIDNISQRNLELIEDTAGKRQNCLVNILDNTSCAMGSRMLRRWLVQPVRDHSISRLRHDAVYQFQITKNYVTVRNVLAEICDIERVISRVSLGTAHPRDLIQLRHSLALMPELKSSLETFDSPRLTELAMQLDLLPTLQAFLDKALVDSPPQTIRDGGVIADGFDDELDELRKLSTDAGDFLNELEQREKTRTGLSTLKVGFNRVHGYYIEVSRLNSDAVPAEYHRRQTLKSTERFITEELKQFEDKILSAKEKSLVREKHLYKLVLSRISEDLVAIQNIACSVAEVDVLSTFAERADINNYSKPDFSDTPGISITNGRHPVVEQIQFSPFIGNDIQMD
ncbi:MAG: DNA mismatch repair protein MutS, partial [Gammaproteobacteria bacterium]|nr:DNA mismatch repair protein MutS [Gammaproteobacteria bacterium]